jgi:lactate dehydrogenase-like 2-hydroxyacid dehydrogenase
LPSPTVVNLIAPRPGVSLLPVDALDRLTSAGWTVLDSPLVGLPGVLLTPHAAGFSLDLYAAMGREVAGDLLRWHAGQPPRHAVDVRRWGLLA